MVYATDFCFFLRCDVEGKLGNEVGRVELVPHGMGMRLKAYLYVQHKSQQDVTIRLPDVRITALDRLWSDHNPILLHIDKTDFGPTPFKLYNSWLLRDDFDNLIKEEWELLDSNLKCHEKFRRLKAQGGKRIDEGSAMPSDNDHRLILLQEIEKIDKFASMDIIQKAHVK
ncbi:hypothetical protein Tco_0373823 [Tanacetum coccineum]